MRTTWIAIFGSALAACGGAVTNDHKGGPLQAGGPDQTTPASPPSDPSSTTTGPQSPPGVTATTTPSSTDVPTAQIPTIDAHASVPCVPAGHFSPIARASTNGIGISGLAYHPNGLSMIAGFEASMPNVEVISLPDGQPIRTIVGHGNVSYGTAFSPDAGLIATGGIEPGNSYDTTSKGVDTARLWDASSGQLVRTLPARAGFYVASVEFSHDGALLATSGVMGDVEIWRVADGAHLLGIPISATVYTARFSSDDTLLLTSGTKNEASIWRVADGTQLRTLRGHAYSVSDAVFSPDGTQIATSSYDKSVMIWDATTGTPLWKLVGHDNYVSHVVWVDQDHLISNDWGGIVKRWSRGADGSFDANATCEWNALGQSIGLAVSPDRAFVSAGGAGTDRTHGIWTWPL